MLRRLLFVLALLAGGPAWSAPCRLAAGGKALAPVVVPADASPRVRQAADALAGMLGRIAGAEFTVAPGDGTAGIAVGTPAGFPALPFGKAWDAKDPTLSEDYLIRTHARGVYLIGASELGVEHAVWDFLYRLGYRQFFPTAAWEVVPQARALTADADAKEHPCYYSRRIWYGYGTWDYNQQTYTDWCARNRATSGIELSTGHAYDGIIHDNRQAFAAHSEYLGLLGGERKSSKLCIGNPALRKLVVDYALSRFEKDSALQSLSMEPSDGDGWCECPQCAALGSVSDRALTLANEVADAVNARFGHKYVGMYAYSQHSPPPTIRVHPGVVVSVATAFITGGYSTMQLLEGWQQKGAVLGIRDYYEVNVWDRDLPGRPGGSDIERLRTSIPAYYEKGARFLSAEAGDSWGPAGLGYYLAARMMWDVREAGRVDALTADFLEKAFGPAKAPMARFYKLIDGSHPPLLSDDLLGRMYRCLEEAGRLAGPDARIRARLDDLVLYTRYVELWMAYSPAAGDARQQAFEALIRHAYRMRETEMVHTKALYRDLPNRDKGVKVPAGCEWNAPEGKNPWKSSEPFSRADLDGFVAAGIAAHPLIPFEPVAFSEKLVPAAKLNLPDVTGGDMGLYSRGVRTYFLWVEKPGALALKAKAGIIYQNRGAAKIDLFPAEEPEGKAVDHADVPPDRQEHDVSLKTPFAGLHRIVVSDGSAATALSWPDGMPMTLRSTPDDPAGLQGRWTLYFYVPRGTKVVGGYGEGVGTLMDGDGKPVHTFAGPPNYYSVPVPAGQDGKLWRFDRCAGRQMLMTVPPYLARSAKEFVLPAEVVANDGK